MSRQSTMAALDRTAMESPSWEHLDFDQRTDEERANDARMIGLAYGAAMRRLYPTTEQRHLETIAFCAAALRTLPLGPFMSEVKQYLALYIAKRAQLGRCVPPAERDDLRRASKAVWNALRSHQ